MYLVDINDNGPVFRQNNVNVTEPIILSIDEGLGVNTPLPGFLVSVVDNDTAVNRFDLRMEGVGNDTFQLTPTFGAGSAVLSLYVRKEANLDYEQPEFRSMELTVSEIVM